MLDKLVSKYFSLHSSLVSNPGTFKMTLGIITDGSIPVEDRVRRNSHIIPKSQKLKKKK